VRPAGGIGTPGAASLPREGSGRSARFFISPRLRALPARVALRYFRSTSPDNGVVGTPGAASLPCVRAGAAPGFSIPRCYPRGICPGTTGTFFAIVSASKYLFMLGPSRTGSGHGEAQTPRRPRETARLSGGSAARPTFRL
jgi:hypothetical protein